MALTERETIIPPPAQLTRVSWGAIFAGAVAAVALTALLGLLGLGIGFGTVDPEQGDTVSEVPKWTLIWWAVTSIVATGIGGFVAARLAGIPKSLTGALHGLAVWSVATILTLWLATTAAGAVLGAATSVVTTTARTAGSVVGAAGSAVVGAGEAAAPSMNDPQLVEARDRILAEAQSIGQAAGIDQSDVRAAQNALAATAEDIARSPGDARQDVRQLIDRMFEGPDAPLSQAERNRLVDELVMRTGVSREEAIRISSRWQTQANSAVEQVLQRGGTFASNAEQTAIRVGGDAMDMISAAAWGMFLISLAGLVAAVVGAALGAPGLGTLAGSAAVRRDEFHE